MTLVPLPSADGRRSLAALPAGRAASGRSTGAERMEEGPASESGAPLIAARDVRRFLREFAAGETIFRAGDRGHCMYIVLDGGVRILRPAASGAQVLAELAPGEFFGEMALVDSGLRMADALATTATRLAEIDRARFIYLVGQQPAFSLTVMRVLARRLARAEAATPEIP
jgi:CRP-like cAMP-binding protein